MIRSFVIFISLISIPSFALPLMDRDYANVVESLQKIAHDNPRTTELFNLGTSDNGQDIYGVKIGSGLVANLVVATHHGNEYGSTEVALAFAEDIAKNPIAGQTIFVIPVLNIEGYDTRSREEPVKGRWYDPNRNYPGPCGTEGPFTLKSTKLLADFIDTENIISSATIHTSFPAVVYPWGLGSEDLRTPYMDTFTKLAIDATSVSKYEIGNSTEVIYPANGTFEDYAYWKHGVWSMLFEVGYSHYPDLKAVKELVRVNPPGLRLMFENAPTERAENHGFSSQCSFRMMILDRHDE